MNSVVICGSRHGNTRKVAEAIALELGKQGMARAFAAEKAPTTFPKETDLVVIGAPTEGHRMMELVARFFDRIDKGALAGKAVAGFDTRLRWPVWLSGSGGAGIVQRFERAGARVITPEMSFFVAGNPPVLEPGELERATAWAASLAAILKSKALLVTA